MKATLILITFSLIVSFQAMAKTKILKSCLINEKREFNEDSIITKEKYVIKEKDGKVFAEIDYSYDGEKIRDRADVKIIGYQPIRKGLVQGYDEDAEEAVGFTHGERLLNRAMALENNPYLAKNQKFNINLRAVRSVKIFSLLGDDAKEYSALVETKDANGRPLGTFYSGFESKNCNLFN